MFRLARCFIVFFFRFGLNHFSGEDAYAAPLRPSQQLWLDLWLLSFISIPPNGSEIVDWVTASITKPWKVFPRLADVLVKWSVVLHVGSNTGKVGRSATAHSSDKWKGRRRLGRAETIHAPLSSLFGRQGTVLLRTTYLPLIHPTTTRHHGLIPPDHAFPLSRGNLSFIWRNFICKCVNSDHGASMLCRPRS